MFFSVNFKEFSSLLVKRGTGGDSGTKWWNVTLPEKSTSSMEYVLVVQHWGATEVGVRFGTSSQIRREFLKVAEYPSLKLHPL